MICIQLCTSTHTHTSPQGSKPKAYLGFPEFCLKTRNLAIRSACNTIWPAETAFKLVMEHSKRSHESEPMHSVSSRILRPMKCQKIKGGHPRQQAVLFIPPLGNGKPKRARAFTSPKRPHPPARPPAKTAGPAAQWRSAIPGRGFSDSARAKGRWAPLTATPHVSNLQVAEEDVRQRFIKSPSVYHGLVTISAVWVKLYRPCLMCNFSASHGQ